LGRFVFGAIELLLAQICQSAALSEYSFVLQGFLRRNVGTVFEKIGRPQVFRYPQRQNAFEHSGFTLKNSLLNGEIFIFFRRKRRQTSVRQIS
jgi:hypothetical protein